MNRQLPPNLQNELQALLGDRYCIDFASRQVHSNGFSYHVPMPPDCVVFPKSTDEVSAIVSRCHASKVPIVPFGAGTSLEGHVLALKGGICLDLSRMNHIVEVNKADMYATVQAGVTRNQLDELLTGSGFFFPIGPGVNATIGGMASTRASGTNAVRYGTMKDNVLSLTVVLPTGQVIKTGGLARKSSAGYDLTRLFVGAEGTLGVITEVTIKLHSVPEAIYAAVCAFPTVESAVNTAIKTIQQGIPIARVELLDATMMMAVNRYSGLHYAEKPTLFLEFHGSPTEVEAQIGKVRVNADCFGGEAFVWEKEEEQRIKLWRARTDAAPAALALRPGTQLMSTDVCVPISQLTRCIIETQRDIDASGILAPILGHVGDGNFHLCIPVDSADADELAQTKALNERLVSRALAMSGTCTGEHGIGVGKLAYMQQEHQGALNVMQAIKQAIDPDNLMNPGKVIPVGKENS